MMAMAATLLCVAGIFVVALIYGDLAVKEEQRRKRRDD